MKLNDRGRRKLGSCWVDDGCLDIGWKIVIDEVNVVK